ncbi:MAG: DnaJ domain-containing protein, partial [Planctomycetota bacterium]|nr:DnaJ domain-containing protein [Planctomycetota bacterium]
MASQRDYYDVLGISRGSSEDEIKSAYRKLALENHPDRNPDNAEAERRFKEAADAYAVLSDDGKRKAYDQYGHAGVDGMAGGGPGFSNVEDIFSAFGDLFGGGGGIFE